MENLIIYGAGGMAKEVAALIEDINAVKPTWNIIGFVDDMREELGGKVNGYDILGRGDYLLQPGAPRNVVIAVSSPQGKEKIFKSIEGWNLKFPVLIHPTARVAGNASLGEGTIVGMDCIVSVNVELGRHVFLNMRTVVGHDAVIGDLSTCLVNCIIAGEVRLGSGVLLGSGSIIMEKLSVGSRAKVGMGAVVSFDVEPGHVVMSRPSKSMYFGE